MTAKRKTAPPEVRFWKKVNKTDGCWLWTASTVNGYGMFGVEKGKTTTAAKFAYELLRGPIPDGDRLVATCKNKLCVRPDHMALGAVARFLDKVDKQGPVPEHLPELGPCWLWTGAKSNGGYGQCMADDRSTKRAHRFAYELMVAPIPPGKDIDHICRNRLCVRPEHLRPVTRKQNMENQGLSVTNKSGYRNVYERDGWFLVEVGHNGRKHFGGAYLDINEAVAAARGLRNSLFTHNDEDRS